MKRFWRAGAATAVIVALAPAIHAALPTEFVIDPSVFQSTVTACEALQVVNPDAGASNPAEGALNAGICEYQVLRAGTDEEGMLKAVNNFENAQTWGLDRSRQATANLLEGLVSCRMAQVELNPTLAANKAQSELFCGARKSAQASFSRVKLSDLRVTYPASAGVSADSLIDAMGNCYNAVNGPLNVEWTPQCSSTVTGQDTIDQAAYDAHQKIRTDYLNGATAPLTAMFSRKKAVADSSKASAIARKAILQQDSDRISASFGVERPALDSAISPPLTSLLSDYQQTLVIAQSVVNSYTAWQRGLFVDKHSPTLKDWSVDVATDTTLLGTTLNNDVAAPQTGATFVVSDAVSALVQRKVTRDALFANAQKLCRVYYCELAVKDKVLGNSSFASACNFQSSALCPQWNTKFTVPGQPATGPVSFSPADFCGSADVNFPAQYMTLGMSKASAAQCWAGAPQ